MRISFELKKRQERQDGKRLARKKNLVKKQNIGTGWPGFFRMNRDNFGSETDRNYRCSERSAVGEICR